MALQPATDLFGFLSPEIASELCAGLDRLAIDPAPRLVEQFARWPSVVERVGAFARRWDGPAMACGWSQVDLYGVDAVAPGRNVSAMGAAFIVASFDGSVHDIDEHAITFVTRAGSQLRVYRRLRRPPAVLAWEL